MTSTEAAFSATHKSPKGDLYTLRGGNLAEFSLNAEQLLGAEPAAAFLAGFRAAFGGSDQAAAVAVAQAAGIVAPPVSTVGGFTPPAVPPVAAPALPPTAGDPGPCAHGPRVYKDTIARGAPWRRWECPVPYSAETKATRCKAVNV